MQIERVQIDHIDIPKRLRAVNDGKVKRLAESLDALGLQSPITLYQGRPDQEGFDLVAGAHRLQAAKSLGWEWIDAIFMKADEIDRQLWEIDENLMRSELTPTQQAEHLAKRKELWEARKTANGVRSFEGRGNKGFASDTANATGVSVRAVQKATARVRDLDEDVRDEIRGTDMDKVRVLDELRKLPKEQQLARLNEMRKGVVSHEEQTLQQFNRLMAAWNAANPDARKLFHEEIDKPIMEGWG